jgi:hypothetical protein
MRSLGSGLAALALVLATAPGVLAQAEGRNRQREGADRNAGSQGETKVIRGVIAGVTVEGETIIDPRTNRAATAEASFLTIVGSERTRGRDGGAADQDRDRNEKTARDRDRDRDDQASTDRQRQNVYLVHLTPDTEIRRAGEGRNEGDRNASDNDQRNQNARGGAGRAGNAESLKFETLELGDRVEVRFVQRHRAGDQSGTANRRHGRHRIYFGDARQITILAGPDRNDRDRGSDRDRDRDSDRSQQNDRSRNRQQNDRDR